MVEHAVQHDADACLVKFCDEFFEIIVVAEPPVYMEKIDRIIAVALAFEQRIEQNRIEAHLFEDGDVLFDRIQPMADLSPVIFLFRPAIPERIDLIKNTLVKPHPAYLSYDLYARKKRR